jgi:hypothetical protein
MRRVIAVAVIITAGAGAYALGPAAQPSAMADAARALIASVDADQRAKLVWAFDAEERFNWHFIPRERQGLSLKAMTDRQRAAAFALLRTGLSEQGFSKAETIRSLEEVLRAMGDRIVRDPELYFFTIFGEPGAASWAWRYEGHHTSQNWTIVGGRAATSPAFFGANPALVMDGPRKGTRALPAEGDLAWTLLGMLSEAQRQDAVVAATAPNEIITGNSRTAAIAANTGLAAKAMTAAQRAMLMRLIEEHAGAQAASLAAARLDRVKSGGLDEIRFAWMGSTTQGPGLGHYYRIQGPAFLIEYDNVQNRANHQHIVWRDFTGDFGADVLGRHHLLDPEHRRN